MLITIIWHINVVWVYCHQISVWHFSSLAPLSSLFSRLRQNPSEFKLEAHSSSGSPVTSGEHGSKSTPTRMFQGLTLFEVV